MQRIVPQKIYDIYLDWGNDLVLGANNDLQTVSDTLRGSQRVYRRLLTNAGDYVFVPSYGAGIPAYVGQALSSDLYQQIQSTIESQIFLEPSVSQDPTPEIYFQTIQQGLFTQINYTDQSSQLPVVINFSISNTGVITT